MAEQDELELEENGDEIEIPEQFRGLAVANEDGKKRGRPKRGTTTSVVINAAERRSMVVELRKAGMTYDNIAKAVIDHFGEESLPKGYHGGTAWRDVNHVLERTRREMHEDAQTIIELELQRLDEILMSLWDRALSGDLKSVDRVLAVMQRRAKMLGLDKTNLYLETDWRKEAADKGLSPNELFEKVVEAYVSALESGAEDAEFRPVGHGEGEVAGGSVVGGAEESDSSTES